MMADVLEEIDKIEDEEKQVIMQVISNNNIAYIVLH